MLFPPRTKGRRFFTEPFAAHRRRRDPNPLFLFLSLFVAFLQSDDHHRIIMSSVAFSTRVDEEAAHRAAAPDRTRTRTRTRSDDDDDDDDDATMSGRSAWKEDGLAPTLDAFASFRDDIRNLAKEGGEELSPSAVLSMCDELRDVVFPAIGVKLEDKSDGSAVWKLYAPGELEKERRREEEQKERKLAAKRQLAKERKVLQSFGSFDPETGASLTTKDGRVHHHHHQKKKKKSPVVVGRSSSTAKKIDRSSSSLVETLKSVGDGILDIKDTEENIFTTLANSSRIDIFYRASGCLTLCFTQFRNGFETLLFEHACNLWMFTVLCIFPFLFYVSLPYGKLSTSLSKAMMLPGNQSLFLQEIVSPIMLVYSFFNGGDWFYFGKKKPGFLKRAWRKYLPFPFNRYPKPNMRMSTKVAVGLWLAHYFNRAIIYTASRKISPTTYSVVICAIMFNLVNAALVGCELARMGASNLETWNGQMWMVVAFIGWFINVHSDNRLSKLRELHKGYVIPNEGLFKYSTCPNYLGEIIQWFAFSFATKSRAIFAFALWTVANLAPRSKAYHKWYVDKFGDEFPKDRKMLVPFAW